MEKTYTKAELQTILMFMGCKNWHAKDISGKMIIDVESIYSKNFTEEKLTAGQIEQSLAEYGERFFYSSLEKVFSISKRVFDREMGICILLGGTSGCGKSTLASILASRLGINTVISTDNIRHMMRSVYPVSERPELFRSSYEPNENPYCSAKVMSHLLKEIIHGFEKQAELLFPCVQDLITSHLHKNESLIIEGVHLTVDFCQSALSNNPNCIPLIIYVGKSEKHAERFAIRSKYMTLEPNVNKYIKYFENIRTIQNHLCIQADRSSLPKVDNTNLDRSLGIIHRTIISYLKNLDTSNSLFTEFSKINEENLRSKEVLKMIRYKRLRQRSSSDVMMGTIDRPTNG